VNRSTPTLVAALLLVASSTSLALAQEEQAGFEPVPAGNLVEGTLTVPAENFSIKTPGRQWEWLRARKALGGIGRNYLCRNRETGERFLLTVFEPGPWHPETAGEEMLKGMRKSQESRGRRFENARHEPADIPAPGSLRLSAKIVAPETTIHFTAYVLAARRIYSIQLFSATPKEPDSFVAFARSFKLIVPVATSAPGATTRPSEVGFVVMMFVYVAILVVSMGGGLLVNAIVGRPVVNGGLLAIVLILAAVTLRVYHDPGGQTLAEKFGYHLAQALLPALIALWAHSHHLKNKAQASRFGE
jgi:hypothetical protein